jgi:pSer/pThr/pTyr-binding forkhead associated (FHA) protein
MSEERTRIMQRSGRGPKGASFLARFRATIVVVSGAAEGCEYPLQSDRVTMGRGPGVDLAFDDSCMSRQHVALELASKGYRLRDLGSTNGVLLNGSRVQVGDLKHGDRFEIGEHVFQYVLDEREQAPRVYSLPDTEK